jgi:hypothetical protein
LPSDNHACHYQNTRLGSEILSTWIINAPAQTTLRLYCGAARHHLRMVVHAAKFKTREQQCWSTLRTAGTFHRGKTFFAPQ